MAGPEPRSFQIRFTQLFRRLFPVSGRRFMLDVQFGQASDPGKIRTNNEDAMGSFIPSSRHQARSHGFLFAVADGVGGLDLGEVASAKAISVLTQEFAKA